MEQLAMQHMPFPCVLEKQSTWDRIHAAETLESIVNQATDHPSPESAGGDSARFNNANMLVPAINLGQQGGIVTHRQFTIEDLDREFGVASMASPENTIIYRTNSRMNTKDEKGKGKSPVSIKKSRAAAIHNESERKRRDKINQRIKTLQEMIPNSRKLDKISMLDEVIKYVKQLQTQVNTMSMPSMDMNMMCPLTMHHMYMMRMGIGAMDMNAINHTCMTPVIPPSTAALMPDNLADHLPPMLPLGSIMPDPLASTSMSQPMSMDAYGTLAAMNQQMQPPFI